MVAKILAGLVTVGLTLASIPAVAADGAAIWKAQCAKCHGETGAADTPAGKAMKAPAIAGNEKIAAMTPADVVAAFKGNKMHASLKLPDADLDAVAKYAKDLAAKK